MSTNFSPTPPELNIVTQIFAQADTQKLGVLTGDVAVKVFSGAKLPPTTLGEIWNISDEDNKGWLPKKGVAIAVRLIGWAQKGEKVTQALLSKPGPLAVIEGVNAVTQQATGLSMSLSKSPPPSFPPLTTQDKAKFQNMFLKQGPMNGLLSGEKARDIFVKSKLSNEQLLKIWNLADTQDRGALDSVDFAIGMYFIQGVMTGKISFIPTTLPPSLYQQAGGVSNSGSIKPHITGGSGSFSPIGSTFVTQLQPEFTGQPFRAPTLPGRPSTTTPANGHSVDWDVSAVEKASSDRYFDTLDTQKKGYIEGEVAVPFMLKSQLPGETLAQIWDLADINSDGRLTRDGFAVAMHLIQMTLAGQELPTVLPPSLLPPSVRALGTIGSPFSPPFMQMQHQQPEPIDLFSFDDTPPSSAISPPIQAMNTGTLRPQTTGSVTTSLSPQQPSRPFVDPFSSAPFHSSPHRDLLSDDDAHPAASPPLHDQSAEIGNVKNQLESTNRSLANAKQEREILEQTIANQASQLSAMQTQLSLAKAAYESEVTLLATFKERRAGQVADIDKARQELITAESNLSALRAEKAEIEGTFLRDKEEARDLHKRMVEAGLHADALKADVEKLKKEAKQQKGLLAIARKQLSTKESERAKVEKEHEDAVGEVTTVTKEKEDVEAEMERLDSMSVPAPTPKPTSPSPPASLIFAAAQPLPATPDIPSPGVIKSNNPFERLAMAGVPSQSASPFVGFANPPSSPPLSATEVSSIPQQSAAHAPESAPVNVAVADAPKDDSQAFDDFTSSLGHHHDTELSYLGDQLHGSHVEEITSPTSATSGNELFMTPPTSAFSTILNAAEKFPSLHDIPVTASKNDSVLPPTLDEPMPMAPPQTDLHSHLEDLDIEDLDIEESDSDDSDSDEDNKPLKVLVANGKASVTASFTAQKVEPFPAAVMSTSPTVVAAAAAPAVVPVSAPFEDVVGSSNNKASNQMPNANGHATPFNFSAIAPDDSAKPLDETLEDSVAGVTEFDETFKGTSSAAPTPAAKFSFDTGFEDTFDFPSNSQIPFSAPQQAAATRNEFDDIFGGPIPSSSTSPTDSKLHQISTATNNDPKFESSFEEAFGGFGSPEEVKPTIPSSPPVTSSARSIPGSFPSSPTRPSPVPAVQPRISEIRAISPSPRARSPPPRSESPKLHASSSSKEVHHEKPKESAPRHSKLSIRLPFGKKKKPAEPMPATALQHLSPAVEHTSRVGTPASDDDVEPVKQLIAMGFSRSQAVDALEKYGYDVPKALNSLLGQ
ncbi:hypothetical protein BDN70DRAFT_883440 [Pholiota conissans]|uniref:Uncharacterized protein n=1 Tax=Pholiota conissans TaxID=109636 RepID=A0A9P6CR16_9AGAR|nr:hypothetical protein BDN70DRAFT_883440 [Pholiota conissans]